MKIPFIPAFIILFSVVSCSEKKYQEKTIIYANGQNLNVRTILPKEWVEFPDSVSFNDDYQICNLLKAAKDTSAWIIFRAYKDSMFEAPTLSYDSILSWQIRTAREGNDAMVMIRKGQKNMPTGKMVYFDFSSGESNSLVYNRYIIFIKGNFMGVLKFHIKNNESEFDIISKQLLDNIEI